MTVRQESPYAYSGDSPAKPSISFPWGVPATRYPETRIGPSGENVATRTEPLAFLTDRSDRASAVSWSGTTSDLFLFSQEDPLRTAIAAETYAYVRNSPEEMTDPTGLCPWTVWVRPLINEKRKPLPFVKKRDSTFHWYFYNEDTKQSIGLGPLEGTSGPGKWETSEKPGSVPGEKGMGRIPDANCDCITRKLANPGDPPEYCKLPGSVVLDPVPWAPENLPREEKCQNCQTWLRRVLDGCGVEDPGRGR